MIAPILDHRGNPIRSTSRLPNRLQNRIHARFDAAAFTSETENHWKLVDSLSAASSASPSVRKILRSRSRYECNENNSYAKGMILLLANSIVGTGPRLQMQTPSDKFNRWIEQEFSLWCKSVGLAKKLRTMIKAKKVDGEAFCVPSTNRRLKTPVQLSLKLLEAEQVTTPLQQLLNESEAVDGIQFDGDGNPDLYHVLKSHPGSSITFGQSAAKVDVDAEQMIHLFREDRPGQRRGIPETTPALPLFSMLRRYVLAVLAAAETAADFAAVMYTDSAALNGEEIPNLAIDEGLPIDRRMFQIMPYGWKMSQLKAEQPTTTFGEFRAAIINEAARCLLLPFNVAAGNSSSYNFASGKLDSNIFEDSIRIERDEIDTGCLDAILGWWFDEAALLPGYIPEEYEPYMLHRHTWFWDSASRAIDPAKDAKATETRLKTGSTHRARVLAEQGRDVDAEDEMAAKSFGLTVEEYRRRLADGLFGAPKAAASHQDDSQDEQEMSDAEQNAEAMVRNILASQFA